MRRHEGGTISAIDEAELIEIGFNPPNPIGPEPNLQLRIRIIQAQLAAGYEKINLFGPPSLKTKYNS